MSDNRYNAPAAMKRIPIPKIEDKALERYLIDFAREIHSAMSAGTVPGSITGDADSVGGMHPDNIMALKTLADTDLNNAILEGTYQVGASSSYANHPGVAYNWAILVVHRAGDYVYQELQCVADKTRNIRRVRTESSWSSWVNDQSYDLLPYGTNLNNINVQGSWMIGDAAQYSNIPSDATYSVFRVTATDQYLVQEIISVITPKRYYRTRTEATWTLWFDVGTSGRGLKNTLYLANWAINISNGHYFSIYQAVAARRIGTGQIWLQGANCETSGGTILLSPGSYFVYGSPITLNIQYSPSQTQSDIITVW